MFLSFPLLQTTLELNIGEAAQTAELSGAGSTFGEFVSSMLQASMIIAAVILLVYLVWAGIDWVTAGGDSGKIEKARQKITQSIIGIIVLAATVAIFSVVQSFLGIEVFDFGGTSKPSKFGSSGFGPKPDKDSDSLNDAFETLGDSDSL